MQCLYICTYHSCRGNSKTYILKLYRIVHYIEPTADRYIEEDAKLCYSQYRPSIGNIICFNSNIATTYNNNNNCNYHIKKVINNKQAIASKACLFVSISNKSYSKLS